METNNNTHTTKIKAGRRTYFIDLKETRTGDYYIVLCETRKSLHDEAEPSFQKSKVFIHPEDISRVIKALEVSYNEMKKRMPNHDFERFEKRDAKYKAMDAANENQHA